MNLVNSDGGKNRIKWWFRVDFEGENDIFDEKWYFYLIQIFKSLEIKCQSNFRIIKDDAISWPDLDNRYYVR